MTSRTTPDDPQGESGVLLSPGPDTNPPLAIMTRWWFWVLLVGTFWSFPLFKSLGAEYPDPLPGFDRAPEQREFTLADGRSVRLVELENQLVVVSTLDLVTPLAASRSFEAFRERRSRLRGLGPLVVHLVLVRSAEPDELDRFLDEMTARRPNNLFVLDDKNRELTAFRESAESTDASLFLLDRHARLRGVYGDGPDELDRFSRESGMLANWVGSDPEPGGEVGP